jgi:riboflavin transporter FmnP
MAKVAKYGRKVKAIALLFCCFLPIYEKMANVAQKRRKVKTIALLFCCFLPFIKNGKSR